MKERREKKTGNKTICIYLDNVLVFSGCHNRIPQIEWLKWLK